MSDGPLNDSLAALIRAAATFSFHAGAEYKRQLPADWDAFVAVCEAGAIVRALVDIGPGVPNVRLVVVVDGVENPFFDTSIRERLVTLN